MVIPAGGDERRLRSHLLLNLEAEHTAVEGERSFEVGDFEVDVTDTGVRMKRAGGVHGTSLPVDARWTTHPYEYTRRHARAQAQRDRRGDDQG